MVCHILWALLEIGRVLYVYLLVIQIQEQPCQCVELFGLLYYHLYLHFLSTASYQHHQDL